jgi:hypothetical protein
MTTLELSNSKHEYQNTLTEKDFLKIQSYIFATFNYSSNSPERIEDYNKLLEATDFNIFTTDKVARELVGLLKKTNDKQTLELFKCMSNKEEFFQTNKNNFNISENVFHQHLSSINNHVHLRNTGDLSKYIFKLGIEHTYKVNIDIKVFLGTKMNDYDPFIEKIFFPFLSFVYFYPNHKLMGAWQLLEENKESLINQGQALKAFSHLRGSLEDKSSRFANWSEIDNKLITIEKDLLELTLSYQEKIVPDASVTTKAKKNKI